MKTVYSTTVAGFTIELAAKRHPPEGERSFHDLEFRVTYGSQVTDGLSYASASAELGSCILHALACEGKLP